MKIYNEEKTQIIENPDLKKGYLRNDRLLVSNEELEEFHFEYKTYPNGGRDKIKVVDKQYKPAEYEDIKVYVLYTEEQIKENRITKIKTELEELNKDFIQKLCGAVIPNYNDKVLRFQTLHNEYRTLLGKEPRQYEEVVNGN